MTEFLVWVVLLVIVAYLVVTATGKGKSEQREKQLEDRLEDIDRVRISRGKLGDSSERDRMRSRWK